jgi:hypothetical protein
VPLPLLALLGALAFAVENAHQSWSALYLDDELGARPATAAAGPAVFAAVVAVTRLAAAGGGPLPDVARRPVGAGGRRRPCDGDVGGHHGRLPRVPSPRWPQPSRRRSS